MPTQYKSPFASAFKSACKRGTNFNTAVSNIAKRNGKSTETVWNSLFKAGLVWRQKFNGSWLYFPSFECTTKASGWKDAQFDAWQAFAAWALSSGQCTPEQLKKNCGSQAEFMSWCKKFWGRQFSSASSSSTKKSSSSRTAKPKAKRATVKKSKSSSTSRKRTTTAKSKSRTSSTSKKRVTSTAKKRTTAKSPTAKKRTTAKSSTAKKRTTAKASTGRKTTKGRSTSKSYKFPTAGRSTSTRSRRYAGRKAA